MVPGFISLTGGPMINFASPKKELDRIFEETFGKKPSPFQRANFRLGFEQKIREQSKKLDTLA